MSKGLNKQRSEVSLKDMDEINLQGYDQSPSFMIFKITPIKIYSIIRAGAFKSNHGEQIQCKEICWTSSKVKHLRKICDKELIGVSCDLKPKVKN